MLVPRLKILYRVSSLDWITAQWLLARSSVTATRAASGLPCFYLRLMAPETGPRRSNPQSCGLWPGVGPGPGLGGR